MTLDEHLYKEEGDKDHLYYDTEGIPSIGIGCNLLVRVPDHIARQITIAPEAKRELYELRRRAAETDVARHLPWTNDIDQVRREVFVALAFQMGIGSARTGKGLMGFGRMLSAAHVGDWDTAAAHLLDSKAARKQAPARFERLAKTLRSGEWA